MYGLSFLRVMIILVIQSTKIDRIAWVIQIAKIISAAKINPFAKILRIT